MSARVGPGLFARFSPEYFLFPPWFSEPCVLDYQCKSANAPCQSEMLMVTPDWIFTCTSKALVKCTRAGTANANSGPAALNVPPTDVAL